MKVGDLIQMDRGATDMHKPYFKLRTGIIIDLHHPWANPQGLGDDSVVKVFWDDKYVNWVDRKRIEVISES